MSTTETCRELDSREADGVRVRLWWFPEQEDLTVTVKDSKTGENFAIECKPDKAMDCFKHPYAYRKDEAA